MELIIKTMAGFEEVCAQELRQLGATEIEIGRRMLHCQGSSDLLYAANIHLRSALRVLLPVAKFMSYDESSFYRMLKKTDWSQYLQQDGTLWIDTVVQSERFNNSQFVARLAKDAIVDQFRENTGVRPSVEKEQPDLRINIHISKLGHTTVSLDSSGEGLHRRGYRQHTAAEAPLNEVLAAGLLLLAGYDGSLPFIDPMCGSGTILCEAAMIAAQRAPGAYRDFGFMAWPNYQAESFLALQKAARDQERRPAQPIVGSDLAFKAVADSREALKSIDMLGYVQLSTNPIAASVPPSPLEDRQPGGILLTNPPYELRMRTGDIEALYQSIGDTFKQKYKGYKAWLFSANRDALKHVGLRTSRKIPLMNGPLEARLQAYDMW